MGATLPALHLHLTSAQARRFVLIHQRLWPPRRLSGKAGILDFVRHAGCIQFDPINWVGQNADLVLQARVADYRPRLLTELLYDDRQLMDGWDKVASIHLTGDRPYFGRHRAEMRRRWGDPASPPMQIAPLVVQAIRERGPLSSADVGHNEAVSWSWGAQSRLGRAALDVLYAMGELGVHHRAGTRRYFDLVERLHPAELLAAADPNPTDEAYQDWHVARRVGGLGIANPSAVECWLAIQGLNGAIRRTVLARLVERGELIPASVEGIAGRTFFIRAADLPELDAADREPAAEPAAAIIAPLDNLTWDRDLLRWLFGFEYTWEVYKPAAQRKYGYYVLPVLYGDRFVARLDPAFDKRTRVLTLVNWWWESGVQPDAALIAALAECLRAFGRYLDATGVRLGAAVVGDASLRQAVAAM